MKDLVGKVAVVTGGASGIGLAMAQRFAAEKMKLVLLDVEAPALAEAAKTLRAGGATVFARRVDVSNIAEMGAALEEARSELGIAHVICNNAGVAGPGGPMWTLSEADWKWTLGVNLWGVIHGVRLLLPALLESGEEGHVVNTASMAGVTSTPFIAPYTATKHSVVAISEVLAKELELVGAKVGVSVLCPGFVKTQIATSMRNRPAESGASAAAPAHPAGPGMMQAMHALVAGGVEPASIADQVVAAIRERRFYILTHPEMKPAIKHRMDDLLDERAPGIDPLMRSLFAPKP